MDIKSYSWIFAISLIILVAAWSKFTDAEESVRLNTQRIGRRQKKRKELFWIYILMMVSPVFLAALIEMVLRLNE